MLSTARFSPRPGGSYPVGGRPMVGREQDGMVGKDRVAVVTGGGRGIGRGIVTELATQGFSVVVNFRSDADAARSTCEEAARRGAPRALPLRADVADPDEG